MSSNVGFGFAPIKAEGQQIDYDVQYVMQPQVIGYQLSPASDNRWVMKQLVMRGNGWLDQSPTSTVKEENLGDALREALAVLMVLPKEGGYIAGIGARVGDEFYIERGRVDV